MARPRPLAIISHEFGDLCRVVCGGDTAAVVAGPLTGFLAQHPSAGVVRRLCRDGDLTRRLAADIVLLTATLPPDDWIAHFAARLRQEGQRVLAVMTRVGLARALVQSLQLTEATDWLLDSGPGIGVTCGVDWGHLQTLLDARTASARFYADVRAGVRRADRCDIADLGISSDQLLAATHRHLLAGYDAPLCVAGQGRVEVQIREAVLREALERLRQPVVESLAKRTEDGVELLAADAAAAWLGLGRSDGRVARVLDLADFHARVRGLLVNQPVRDGEVVIVGESIENPRALVLTSDATCLLVDRPRRWPGVARLLVAFLVTSQICTVAALVYVLHPWGQGQHTMADRQPAIPRDPSHPRRPS